MGGECKATRPTAVLLAPTRDCFGFGLRFSLDFIYLFFVFVFTSLLKLRHALLPAEVSSMAKTK